MNLRIKPEVMVVVDMLRGDTSRATFISQVLYESLMKYYPTSEEKHEQSTERLHTP